MRKKTLVYFSLILAPLNAVSASGVQETFDPLSVAGASEGCSLCVSVLNEAASTPPFRAGERDIAASRLAAQWIPHPTVRLRAQAERLRMHWPSGDTASGWGDIRLGTTAALWTGGSSGQRQFGLDWSMKLPNAADDGELGSDESDAAVGLFGQFQSGPWWLGLRASLLILGDPLQFANQDDALLAGAALAFHKERWSLLSRLNWREESPRNARDVRWLAGARWSGLPNGLWLAAEGGAGLTLAAPTWQASLLVGVSRACRASNRD